MGEFIRSKIANIEVLECSGEITIKNVENFKDSIYELVYSDGDHLLLNLQETSYMNSAALGFIADAAMKAKKAKKKFVIGGIQPNIQDIFKIIKFEIFITLFKEMEDAIQYFSEE